MSFPRIGWLGVAGLASIAAGMIHAAAAVAHADHRQAMWAFLVIAACQGAWGTIALMRPERRLRAIGGLGNLLVLGGWLAAKTMGVPFVDGLEDAERVQVADGLAAALAAVAVTGAFVGTTSATANRAAAIAAGLAIAIASIAGIEAASGHTHGHDGHTAHPYDPARPIDLGGVDGVTPAQQARAENLVAVTLLRLPRYADVRTAAARGFRSIGDAASGYEHYIEWSDVNDDTILDPDHPESLVYRVDGERRTLVAAMYMLPNGVTLETAPDVGGRLTQWHTHDDLCLTPDREAPVVAAVTAVGGECPPPLSGRIGSPMLHVWIVPHECGPFASLEGIAAGQVRDGEQRLCDHEHGTG